MSGWGRLLLDRQKTHDDLRLLDVAIKKRWEIGDDFRSEIVERLRAIVVTSEDDELAIKAIAQVRQLESQNQKDEHKDLDEFSNRILQLADRLGIATGDGGTIDAIEGGATRSDGVSSTTDERAG